MKAFKSQQSFTYLLFTSFIFVSFILNIFPFSSASFFLFSDINHWTKILVFYQVASLTSWDTTASVL